MRCLNVVNAPTTGLCAQSFKRFRTPLAARKILQCSIVLKYFWLHDFAIFKTQLFGLFFFFACPARKLPPCIVYVDQIFVALLSSISCPARSFNASSCLIIFNSMTLLFSRLSCSVPSFSLRALPANYHHELFTSIKYLLRWVPFKLPGKILQCFILLNYF